MYTRLSELKNLVIAAQDGDIGRCRDFLFDDEHWTVRYLEINTSRWLLGRRVLLPISWAASISWAERAFTVDVSKRLIETAPPLAEPISAEAVKAYLNHFGR